jgi:hypothetical protein
MHGLINRSIEGYVRAAHGDATWARAAAAAGLDPGGFEAMLTYDDALTPRVLDAVARVLGRPRGEIMEDIGTFLVTGPGSEPLRRLLRFGGVDFEDFLQSLDELPDRARLAVPDLVLPALRLKLVAPGRYHLDCAAQVAGFGHVIMGILRAMADDYGALVLLDAAAGHAGTERLTIDLVSARFSEARTFRLGAETG